MSDETFDCPVCGAPVRRGALSCRNCGADERTGWNEEATRYDGMDFIEDERPTEPDPKTHSSTGVPYFTWLVAAGLLVVMIGLVLGLS